MSAESTVAHQFEDAAQQRDAATLGMWVFLATEVLFFGALFLGYTVYRLHYPEIFRAASEHNRRALRPPGHQMRLTDWHQSQSRRDHLAHQLTP